MHKLTITLMMAFAFFMSACSTADGLAEDVGLRNAEIGELHETIQSLENDILILNIEISSLENQIIKLKGDLASAENTLIIDEYTDAIALLEDKLDETQAALEEITQ